MATETPGEVYQRLTAAGFDPAAATVMTAIAGAESGYNPAAVGDVSLENSVWGPSYGLFQIRTAKSATGSGADRDITYLTDVDHQAAAAYDISKGGTDFSPWSTYKSGAYKRFLAGIQNTLAPGSVSTSAVADTTPIPHLPTWGPSWLPWNWAQDAGNAAIDKTNETLSDARTLALEALFVVLGIGLIGFGVVKLAGPRLKTEVDKAGRAAKTAAVAAV